MHYSLLPTVLNHPLSSKQQVNDAEVPASSPIPNKQSFASPIPPKTDKYAAEMGSPKAEAIFASFKGSIKDASDVSSDDGSLCLDEVDEDLLDEDDLAADEPGPSAPQLRIAPQSKSVNKSRELDLFGNDRL